MVAPCGYRKLTTPYKSTNNHGSDNPLAPFHHGKTSKRSRAGKDATFKLILSFATPRAYLYYLHPSHHGGSNLPVIPG